MNLKYTLSFRLLSIPLCILGSFLLGLLSHNLIFRNEELSPSRNLLVQTESPVSSRADNWQRKGFRRDIQSLVTPPSPLLESHLKKLLQGDIPTSWENELANILKLSRLGTEREEALLILFSKWAALDFEAALHNAGKLGAYAYEIKKDIFCQFAERDPQSALLYYNNNKDIFINHSYINKTIAQNWAKKSPEEALEWCFSFDEPEAVEIFYQWTDGVLLGSKEKQIESYLDTILARNDSVPGSMIARWAETDPEGALAWVLSRTPDKETYRNIITRELAKRDLNEASPLLLSASEGERDLIISDIAESARPYQSPEKILSWIMEIVPASQQSELSLSPIASWTRDNPGASKQWIQNLPDSSAKNKAIGLYAQNVRSVDLLDSTLELIESIQNNETKEKVRQETIQYWKSTNTDLFNL